MSNRNNVNSGMKSWGLSMGLTVSVWRRAIAPLLGAGLVTLTALEITATAAAAAELTHWSYNPDTHQLDITLSGGTMPYHFLLAQPARIVVDLPNTQVGSVAAEQTYTGAIQRIRVSQFQPEITRIVIELAPDAELSGDQIELRQSATDRWSLRPLLVGDDLEVAESTDSAADSAADPTMPNTGEPVLLPENPPENLPDIAPAAIAIPETGVPVVEAIEPVSELDLTAELPADALPPLEPGAIELPVILPDQPEIDAVLESDALTAEPEFETATLEEDADSVTIEPPQVPSLRSVLAAVEATRAIDQAQTAEPVVQADASPPSFDPNAPVLDATIATEELMYPVLDGTMPAFEIVRPSQTAEPIAFTEPTAEPEEVEQPEAPVPDVAAELEADPDSDLAADPTDINVGDESEIPIAESPISSEAEPIAAVEFGQPLPDATLADSAETQADSQSEESDSAIPSGTVLSLRYPGENSLALQPGVSRQDVLILETAIVSNRGEIMIPAGSLVIGRFEVGNREGKFIVQAIAFADRNLRLSGESLPLEVESQEENAIAPDQQVVIRPNQIIEVQTTEDIAYRP